MRYLILIGLGDLPWTVVGRDHSHRTKPAPDPHLHAARLWKVAPH
ncbi:MULTISPECIES: HAD family hydrolase [unclassified Streptomyces]